MVPGLAVQSSRAVFVGGKLQKGLPPGHYTTPIDWLGCHHLASMEKNAAGDPMCHKSITWLSTSYTG